MSPSPQTSNGFTEVAEIPRGRKARQVPEHVLTALRDSATRSVAFAKTATPELIDELRRDLGSAQVRTKYEITMGTEKLSETSHKLTFAARHRANGGQAAPAPAPAPEPAAAK
jgi:hypothetical protein